MVSYHPQFHHHCHQCQQSLSSPLSSSLIVNSSSRLFIVIIFNSLHWNEVQADVQHHPLHLREHVVVGLRIRLVRRPSMEHRYIRPPPLSPTYPPELLSPFNLPFYSWHGSKLPIQSKDATMIKNIKSFSLVSTHDMAANIQRCNKDHKSQKSLFSWFKVAQHGT